MLEKVEPAIDELLADMENNKRGILPLKPGSSIKEYTVDFCQGAPGIIPLLTVAAEVYPHKKNRILDAARLAAELTWKEGLLPQGNGLASGIAGNGYLMHTLYRTLHRRGICDKNKKLQDEAMIWWERAHLFARAMFEPDV